VHIEHGVDFVVVGGVAAVLGGAPVSTFDLDVVHSREKDNIARLLRALKALGAYYRMRPKRRLKPEVSDLSSGDHQLLMTRFGPLDLLGSIGRSRGYEDLLANTVKVEVGRGVRARVLNLETLFAVKEETADQKDLAALPILRRTLEERNRR